jgi:hypothetical protein
VVGSPPNNLWHQLQTEGWNANLSVAADTFATVDAPAASLTGVLELLPAIDPALPLGSDIREAAILHVLRASYPYSAGIDQGDQLTQTTIPNWQTTWEVTNVEDNGADMVVRVHLRKVIPALDT